MTVTLTLEELNKFGTALTEYGIRKMKHCFEQCLKSSSVSPWEEGQGSVLRLALTKHNATWTEEPPKIADVLGLTTSKPAKAAKAI